MAHWSESNPLTKAWLTECSPQPGVPLITWSGWLGSSPFERDPRTWGPGGLAILKRMVETLRPVAAAASTRILFRPHARHLLGDPTRCQLFLREIAGNEFGIALDAAAMLEDSMLPNAEDHLTRTFENLGATAAAVVLTNAVAPAGDSDAALTLGNWKSGALNPDLLVKLVEQHCSPDFLCIDPFATS